MRALHVALWIAAVTALGTGTSSAKPAPVGTSLSATKRHVVKHRPPKHRPERHRVVHRAVEPRLVKRHRQSASDMQTPHGLTPLSFPPPGEEIAERPSVHDGELGADIALGETLQAERDGRHLQMGIDTSYEFHTTEGPKLLWAASAGGGGGPYPGFTLEPGGNVVIVGHNRFGYRAFDSLSGKGLTDVGDFAVAPGAAYGVISPMRLGTSNCVTPRAFSLLTLDASHQVTTLDVPLVPKTKTVGEHMADGVACEDHFYNPSVAFSVSDGRFAIGADAGVFLFEGASGKRLAWMPLPLPLLGEDQVDVDFSKSGSFVIVTHTTNDENGNSEKTSVFWLRID